MKETISTVNSNVSRPVKQGKLQVSRSTTRLTIVTDLFKKGTNIPVSRQVHEWYWFFAERMLIKEKIFNISVCAE